MKILFLDIDGVLNCESSRHNAHRLRAGDWGTFRGWLEGSVNELKRIINETGCQIVISSDWRLRGNVESLREGFEAFELPNWLGVTPELGMNNSFNGNRGREIEAWLAGAATDGHNIESFAIVDDNPWMLDSQASVFVQTSDTQGMTRNDADRLIRILNRVPHVKTDGI